MNDNLTEIMLALNGNLPVLEDRYCKKCGEKLVCISSKDHKLRKLKEYSESTGEPFIQIEKTLRCPKGHTVKKFTLVENTFLWSTFSVLKASKRLCWWEKQHWWGK